MRETEAHGRGRNYLCITARANPTGQHVAHANLSSRHQTHPWGCEGASGLSQINRRIQEGERQHHTSGQQLWKGQKLNSNAPPPSPRTDLKSQSPAAGEAAEGHKGRFAQAPRWGETSPERPSNGDLSCGQKGDKHGKRAHILKGSNCQINHHSKESAQLHPSMPSSTGHLLLLSLDVLHCSDPSSPWVWSVHGRRWGNNQQDTIIDFSA